MRLSSKLRARTRTRSLSSTASVLFLSSNGSTTPMVSNVAWSCSVPRSDAFLLLVTALVCDHTVVLRKACFLTSRDTGVERPARTRGRQLSGRRPLRSIQPQVWTVHQSRIPHIEPRCSGRLPYTIGKSITDYSAQITYTGSGIVPIPYNEGLFIDYRHFDQVSLLSTRPALGA